MGTLSNIEKSIQIISFLLKKRKTKVDALSRRMDLNEDQKIKIGEETELMKHIALLIDRYKEDINKNLGRLPPQALDLEESVLGAVMIQSSIGKQNGHPDIPPAIEMIQFLEPEHFYLEAHKIIFKACRELHPKEPVDMRSVVFKLREMGQIEAIGGATYIANLTAKVSSTGNVAYHAQLMVEMAMRRKMIELAGTLIMDAYDLTRDLFEMKDEAEKDFRLIDTWIANLKKQYGKPEMVS